MPDYYVQMTGLPQTVTETDIRCFFSNCDISLDGIAIALREDGSVRGDGYVGFENERSRSEALRKHNNRIGGHFIQLKVADKDDFVPVREMYLARKSNERSWTEPPYETETVGDKMEIETPEDSSSASKNETTTISSEGAAVSSTVSMGMELELDDQGTARKRPRIVVSCRYPFPDEKDSLPSFGPTVKLRGLATDCDEQDIQDFFKGDSEIWCLFELMFLTIDLGFNLNSVTFGYASYGKTGDAWVTFASKNEALDAASHKNLRELKGCYVDIYLQ